MGGDGPPIGIGCGLRSALAVHDKKERTLSASSAAPSGVRGSKLDGGGELSKYHGFTSVVLQRTDPTLGVFSRCLSESRGGIRFVPRRRPMGVTPEKWDIVTRKSGDRAGPPGPAHPEPHRDPVGWRGGGAGGVSPPSSPSSKVGGSSSEIKQVCK